jgi:hypothetical protein
LNVFGGGLQSPREDAATVVPMAMGREAEVTWTLPKGGGGGEGEGKDEDEGQVVARVLVDLRGATRMGALVGMDEDEEEVVLVVGVVVVADTHLTAPAAVEVVVVVIDLSSRTCRQQRRV